MTTLRLLLPMIVAIVTFSFHVHAWEIPDPAKLRHPAAEAAPAVAPSTYPDEAGFTARRELIFDALKGEDLGKWRRGFFTGGDPGKYLPPAAMAKLIRNPEDEEARKYMNDDRSWKEHYHFAAQNWSRFYPLFNGALTPETRKKVAEAAAKTAGYHAGTGTENHRTQWYTAALVLPHFLEGGRLGNLSKDQVLDKMGKWLRTYVRNLYHYGMGEWDSSTYLTFTVHGMQNIYDFSPVEEHRLLAAAALDWLGAGMALKYRDGIFTGPNQRGYYDKPMQSIASQTEWLWWDSNKKLTAEDNPQFRYAMHAATSAWRPSGVLTRIARKELPVLPFETRASKPNYYFGQGSAPKAGAWVETVYNTPHYTLGSLWNGFGGQTTRWQLVASTPVGGVAFTGGSVVGRNDGDGSRQAPKYGDGGGRFDQSGQDGSLYINLSRIPEDEVFAYSAFRVPPEIETPREEDGWFFFQAGQTYVAVRGLGEKNHLGTTDLSDRQSQENEKAKAEGREPRHKTNPTLRFEGRRTGFILESADAGSYPDFDAFRAAVKSKVKVDTSRWASSMEVVVTGLSGREMSVRHQEDKDRAEVRVAGRLVETTGWPVYDGPYVHCDKGVLTVNDGKEGYVVDFSGDLPVYKPWKP